MATNGKLLVTSLTFLLTWIAAVGQLPVPDYQIVLDTFFARYNEVAVSPLREMRFEKRPEGYSVSWVVRSTGAIDDSMPFWTDGRFLQLPFQCSPWRRKPDRAPGYTYFRTHEDAWKYDWLPYYGYPGYFSDIIDLLEEVSNPTDTQLYALAHAWSARASNMAMGWSVYALPEMKVAPAEAAGERFSANQVDAYLRIRQKAWSYYQLLQQRAPDFTTPAGWIHTLYSQDVMTAFLQLLMLRGEEAALAILPSGLYDAFLLEGATNLLNQSPADCLFFAASDSEALPLLYVQATTTHRADVRVIISEFLMHPDYINFLRKPVFQSNPPRLSITQGVYSDAHSARMPVDLTTSSDTISISDFLGQIGQERIRPDTLSETSFCSVPGPLLSMPVSGSQLVQRGLVSKKQSGDLAQALIADPGMWAGFLSRRELVMLDLIATNDWRIPFCTIANGFGGKTFPIGYAWRHGLLARHSPVAPGQKQDQYTPAPTLFLESSARLLGQLQLGETPRDEPAHRLFWNCYLSAFEATAVALIEQGNTTDAMGMVMAFFKRYPDLGRELRHTLLPFVRICLTADREKEALEIAEFVLKLVEAPLSNSENTHDKLLNWLEQAGKQYESANLVSLVGEVRNRLSKAP